MTLKEKLVEKLKSKAILKIAVNPATSKWVQEVCFENGVTWVDGISRVCVTEYTPLVIGVDLRRLNSYTITWGDYLPSKNDNFTIEEFVVTKELLEKESEMEIKGIKIKETEPFDEFHHYSKAKPDLRTRDEVGIEHTLVKRGEKYGEFADQAQIGQKLKSVIALNQGWGRLTPDKKEALEMICTKIARILNGDPEYKDNWVDIAGYATLVANTLKEEGK